MEHDQFHELKEYFRYIICPSYSEWTDIPEDERLEAKAIFVKCVGEDLLDYFYLDNSLLKSISFAFNENYRKSGRYNETQAETAVNIFGYSMLDMISTAINNHVSKIFYECVPSSEEFKKVGGF